MTTKPRGEANGFSGQTTKTITFFCSFPFKDKLQKYLFSRFFFNIYYINDFIIFFNKPYIGGATAFKNDYTPYMEDFN